MIRKGKFCSKPSRIEQFLLAVISAAQLGPVEETLAWQKLIIPRISLSTQKSDGYFIL
jgi:hypothetical protein